ncbi:MAG: DUF2924 domain-containing protein [Pseudomonadota bacterium]
MSELRRIETLGIREAKLEWQNVFGKVAPVGFNTDLIRRAIANHVQERHHGGLSKKAASTLRKRMMAHAANANGIFRGLKPGTRLSRVWHGRSYNVTVLEDDAFDYQGRRYTSLSTIAREITGVTWSGPRFFGLRSMRGPDA